MTRDDLDGADADMCALFVPDSDSGSDSGAKVGGRGRACPDCGSRYTKEVDQPTPRAALFSPRMPRLRWRQCLSCGSHFLAVLPRRYRLPR
jgi:transcriptional regulator NrdR family protein